MPKSPKMPCAKCGKLLWFRKGISVPGKSVCQPCRAEVPKSTNGTRRPSPCPACGKPAEVGRSCSQLCAAQFRRWTAADKTCLACAVTFVATAPNQVYCAPCANDRRRDHYRRKNRSRLGYTKSIRAFPVREMGERDGWRCHLCGMSVDRFLSGLHPGMASYDHVVPTSRGGRDDPDNLKLAHLRCNIIRSNRELDGIPA